MARTGHRIRSDSSRVALSLLCGAWLLAFLHPVEQLGFTVNAQEITLLVAILCILQFASFTWVRAVGAFCAVVGILLHAPAGRAAGWGNLLGLVANEANAIRQALVDHVVLPILQTTVLLVLLCAAYWLILYASRRVRLWVFYNVLAIGVLGVIDSSTPIHPAASAVILLLAALLAFAMARFDSISASGSSLSISRFFVPAAMCSIALLTSAQLLPKYGPVWGNPFSHLTRLYGQSDSGDASNTDTVIGFQTDNSSLGGSFTLNYDPVFSVVEPYPSYLRGTVYTAYTGQGWVSPNSTLQPVQYGASIQHPAEMDVRSGVPVVDSKQQVTVLTDGLKANVIFGGYAIRSVTSVSAPKGTTSLLVDLLSGTVFSDHWLQDAESYTVQSAQLTNPDSMLRHKSTKVKITALPLIVQEEALALPPTLPNRVKKLAKDVAGGSGNEYDEVLRVEQYLKSHYQYKTTNIPRPSAKQDYVNQFLFETKQGYCNNFSSAMAVMLRTLGIPTRWVVGFAPGTPDDTYVGPNERWIVRNADAHSWVEVYFPNVGWIPFDPTPGFAMTFAPNPAAGGESGGSGSTGPDQSNPGQPPQSKGTPPGNAKQPLTGTGSHGTSWAWLAKWPIYIAVVFCLLAVSCAWVFRRKLRVASYQLRWDFTSVQSMETGIAQLLQLLRSRGELVTSDAMTLRDLAGVAESYGVAADDVRHFIHTAELALYSDVKPGEDDLRRAKQTCMKWVERVLRKTRD